MERPYISVHTRHNTRISIVVTAEHAVGICSDRRNHRTSTFLIYMCEGYAKDPVYEHKMDMLPFRWDLSSPCILCCERGKNVRKFNVCYNSEGSEYVQSCKNIAISFYNKRVSYSDHLYTAYPHLYSRWGSYPWWYEAFFSFGITSWIWNTLYIYIHVDLYICRSQRPRRLRHEISSLAQTLGSLVRIPLKAWVSVCDYSVFVLSCVFSSLATGWSTIQGVLSTALRLRNWIETNRFKDAIFSEWEQQE
jgi:hypothetical protein